MITRTRLLAALVFGAATIGAAPQLAAAEGSQPDGAPTPSTLQLPSGPGSVRGLADDPTVDGFSGQASYSVPLELPKGPRGFAPQVALAYSGDLGNGALGIGWYVATPAIRVSTRQGVPGYDGTDELELSGVGAGGRLVSIAPGEWRVEGQGNAVRVRQDGAGYVAWGPDGTRYRFGITAAGRQVGNGHTAAWMVEEIIDVADQHVAYAYAASSGALYLTSIAWGPSQSLRAVFELAARPDVNVSFRLGFPVTTAQRVAAVRIEADGAVQRRYELAYDQGFAVSRLHQVDVIGRGGTDRMPPLTFTYASRTGQAPQPLGVGTWRLDPSTVLVDVDSDGAADLLRLTSTGHQYRLNRGGSFGDVQALTGAAGLTLSTARLADVEGHARPDLIGVSSGTWRPYRLDGSVWTALGSWTGSEGVPLKGSNVVVADLDGDDRVDVVQWNDLGLIVRFGTATGLAPPVSRPKIGGVLLPASNVAWHDVNGDGLTDALRVLDAGLYVYLGHGDGTFEPGAAVAWPWAGTLGHADVRFADLDRDGLLDLVRVDLSTVSWYAGKSGGGFVTTPRVLTKPGMAGSDTIVAIEDANGNGSADVVWSSATGMWAIDLAGATNAGMLVAVDNGLGKRVTFEYTATTALAGADADAKTPWTWHLPMAIPVLTDLKVAAGDGDPVRDTSYRVRDGFWDTVENRFGGFLTSVKTVHGGGTSPDLIETTRFHPGLTTTRVLRGEPIEVRVENGAGSLVSVTTNVWVARTLASLPTTSALLRKATLASKTVQLYEGQPATSPLSTLTTYTYDAEARLAVEVDTGRTDLTGDERRLEHGYASDDILWVRDLPAEDKTLATDGTVVAWTRTYYGDATTELPLGQAGRGWKRRVEAYLADTASWIPRERRSYDALGNPTAIVDRGVAHAVTYDPTGRFPIEEHVATGGADLVWRMAWDSVLGAPTTLTGPDGVATTVGYDGLGRPISRAIGSHAPHEVYRYAWTAPRPYGSPRPFTETWRFDGALASVTPAPSVWTDGAHWRQQLAVTNGAGEALYTATRSAGDRWIVEQWTERDAMGRPTFMGDAVEVATSPIVLTRPTAMVGQIVQRDALGRATAQTLADGSLRSFQHAAFTDTVAAPGLAPVTTVSDGLGRAIETRRATELTRAAYDAGDHVTRYEMVRGADVVVAQFVHDTLGRLVRTQTPESGVRTLRYDDGDHLLEQANAAGQRVTTSYDVAGRMLSRTLDDGTAYRYHYDAPRLAGLTFTGGRLAWVEEPTGGVDLAYDELGHVTRKSRALDGSTGRVDTAWSTSGLPLSIGFDQGAYAVAMSYDAAGRPIQAGALWSVVDQDAAGRILDERAGNGVHERYVRDLLGLPARVDVVAPSGTTLYGVTVDRNAWGGITSLEDDDQRGLDHSATFGYDDRARLTSATIGDAQPYAFTFAFDDLQNMTARRLAAPAQTGAMIGTYRYGENGAAPRQLTSVADDAGVVRHQLSYDAAGRQVGQDGRQLAFNALDQLVAVHGLAGGDLRHAYGYDGERLRTIEPGGATKRWLFPELSEESGAREYFVSLGGRTIARVRVATGGSTLGTAGGVNLHAAWLALLGTLAVGLALMAALRRGRRPRWQPTTASVSVALALYGCAGPATESVGQAVTAPSIVYFHRGVAAGPELFTDASGAVVEERRFEPFGQPIDAQTASGTGAPSFATLDENVLGKPVEPTTGWSFHGARWYASEEARWLSVDPPTLAADAKHQMAQPWTLHPYQYVDQNPMLYWDPDGREKVTVDDKTYSLPTRRDGNEPGAPFDTDELIDLGLEGAHGAGAIISLTAETVEVGTEVEVLGLGGELIGTLGLMVYGTYKTEKDVQDDFDSHAKAAYYQGFLAALLDQKPGDARDYLSKAGNGTHYGDQWARTWNRELDRGMAAAQYLMENDPDRILTIWKDVMRGLNPDDPYPQDDPTNMQMILDGSRVMQREYTR